MAEDEQSGSHPAALVCHPLVLLAVAIVAINDHVLKESGWLPGVVTGKLSDVAGLFFFPILVAVLAYLAARYVERLPGIIGQMGGAFSGMPRLLVDSALFFTVVGFTAINVIEPVNAFAERVWGVFTMDPTDLFCLPMVLVARHFALQRWPGAESPQTVVEHRFRWRHFAAVVLAGVVSIATPAQVRLMNYPHWYLVEPRIECHHQLEITPWFATTGKEGAGMVLRFDAASEETRQVEVRRAIMRLEVVPPDKTEGTFGILEARRAEPVEVDERASVYLPFVFDNERAWNEGKRRAMVEVDLLIDNEPVHLSYAVTQRAEEWSRTYRNPDYRPHGLIVHDHVWEQRQEEMEEEQPAIRHAEDAPGGYALRIDPAPEGGCPEVQSD